MRWMDDQPYQFILHHKDTDLKGFLGFAHRTFNATDLLYFIEFLQYHFTQHDSLEDAFVSGKEYKADDTREALTDFHNQFFSIEHPDLPVIAQSAFSSKEDKEKASEAGCDSFITKPISKTELLKMMQVLLHP